ncbi:MAG: hypothetical protein A3H97_16715 [Acidobacteria bacterium RIFCSPLOWO2_02_FULL_65_29]|nr:MAG: hypothetical protein A3H97_16715 [Acidobacteria bacterium RIFCSPLOWO2_02_FULL_65_29]
MPDLVLAAGGAWPLAWCVSVLFAAYALRGATGFGAGVVAIPLLLFVLPLPVVIPLVTATGMLASLGQSVREFRRVNWAGIRRLVVPTLAGVALGLWLFTALDAQLLLKACAGFIIGYALWSLGPARAPRAPGGWLAALAGALGGLVATLFGGMAGPFYVVYLNALELDKARFRATVSVVLFLLAAVRMTGYGGLGLYDARVLALLAVSLPVMVVAMLAGDHWHRRLDEARFRRVVSALMALSGLALLFK